MKESMAKRLILQSVKKVEATDKLCYSVNEAGRRDASKISRLGKVRPNGQDVFTDHSFNGFRSISTKQKIATGIHGNRKIDSVNVHSFLFANSYMGSN